MTCQDLIRLHLQPEATTLCSVESKHWSNLLTNMYTKY